MNDVPLFSKNEQNKSLNQLRSSVLNSDNEDKQRILEKGYKQNVKFSYPVQLKLISILLLIEAFIEILSYFLLPGDISLFYQLSLIIIVLPTIGALISILALSHYARALAFLAAFSQLIFKLVILIFFFQLNKLFDILLGLLIAFYILSYFSKPETKFLFH